MKKLYYILLTGVLTCGCSQVYYAPKSQHIPLFTGTKQLNAQAGFGISERTKHAEVSASYSLVNHLAITGSLNFTGETAPIGLFDGSEIKGIAGGFGIIGFYPFAERAVFETTIGFSAGDMEIYYSNFPTDLISYHAFYFQPSIGYTTKYFEAAFSVKVNQHNYNSLDPVYRDYFKLSYPSQTKYVFVEPAITLRGGGKTVKFQLQLVKSGHFQTHDFEREDYLVNMGISVSLGWSNLKD